MRVALAASSSFSPMSDAASSPAAPATLLGSDPASPEPDSSGGGGVIKRARLWRHKQDFMMPWRASVAERDRDQLLLSQIPKELSLSEVQVSGNGLCPSLGILLRKRRGLAPLF